MGSPVGRFLLAVRRALRLREADPATGRPGDPAELWRFGLYDARVDACAADGSTVDVTPDDPRLDPIQAVPVRVGVPGHEAVVQAGALVLVGWVRGDASRPYAVPHWAMGASVTKLVINGTAVYLGAESGAQLVALANLVKDELDKIALAFTTFVPGTGGAEFPDAYTTAGPVAAANVWAK